MSYYLFLDDVRVPKDVKWVTLPAVNWVIVRNYDEFVKTITEKGLPFFISFDHDLGEEHYPRTGHGGRIQLPKVIPYDTYKEKTGYHCAQWLVNHCHEHKKRLPVFIVHSLNSVGKENIYHLLWNFKDTQL